MRAPRCAASSTPASARSRFFAGSSPHFICTSPTATPMGAWYASAPSVASDRIRHSRRRACALGPETGGAGGESMGRSAGVGIGAPGDALREGASALGVIALFVLGGLALAALERGTVPGRGYPPPAMVREREEA